MVDEANTKSLAGSGNTTGERQVFYTRRRVAARVVVEKDDAGSVRQKRRNQESSRLDGRAIQGAHVGNDMADTAAGLP